MTPRPPDFVVAGAARAGSTALVESLRSHPDVFVTQPKEPHFLAYAGERPTFTGPGDDLTINAAAVTRQDDYLALFDGAEPGSTLGEGSVSTLYRHEQALPRLHELNPQARLVLVLRDPVDRAFSSFQYLRNRGYERQEDFLDAVAREDERRRAGWHHLWHYTAMSTYADPVAHAHAVFGADRVHVEWYDDLVDNADETLDRVHAFVGVDPARRPREEGGRVNVSGVPKRAWLQAAMHQAARSRVLRGAVKSMVPFGVRERIRNANLTSQQVSPRARAELVPVFVPDLDRLEKVLGRPVPERWRS
jgi:Sulfotransferase family